MPANSVLSLCQTRSSDTGCEFNAYHAVPFKVQYFQKQDSRLFQNCRVLSCYFEDDNALVELLRGLQVKGIVSTPVQVSETFE